MSVSKFIAGVCACVLLVATGPVAVALQSGDELATPDLCRKLLKESLVDFYLPHSIDEEHGGYHQDLDEAGKFKGGEKFLTFQARQLWFFSALAKRGIEKEASLKAAKSGYDFLQTHFLDSNNGGYFLKTHRDGKPLDTHKHVYPNAFVIYGLVEYYRASGEQAPLDHAMELFQVLEKHCYDRDHGGYKEYFHEDWKPVTDAQEWGVVGAIGTKTYNTHLHLLEAFAQLYRETKDELVGQRLGELITINTVTVKYAAFPLNIDAHTNEWMQIGSEKNCRASFGHDVECSWLVLDALDALGQRPEILKAWAKETCGYSIRYGYDRKHGGFYYSGPPGKISDDKVKEWWTQSEALVAMLTLHRLTGHGKYKEIFDKTFAFVVKHQIAEGGGWYATLERDGSVKNDRLSSMWQGAYHNGRALMMCEELLREN